jgi:16S rRNA (guanine1207-N2)-methyltransferase
MAAKQFLNQILMALTPDVAVSVAPETLFPGATRIYDSNLLRTVNRRSDRAVCAEVTAVPTGIACAVTEATNFKPRALMVYEIGELAARLKAGGRLYFIERHRGRAKSARKLMAQLFSEVEIVEAADAVLIKGSAPLPFDHRPRTTVVRVTDQTVARSYDLKTWPGLFSGGSLDRGTAFLIDHFPRLGDGARLLDVGCGYGPFSVVAAGRGGAVSYLDVDATALRITGQNLAAHDLKGEPLLCAKLSSLERDKFDCVVSNPPTHAGSDVLQGLIDGMRRVVKPSGHITIVVRRHLAYEKWIGRHESLADDGRYKLLRFFA